jgi:hypothetical protein
MDKLITFINSLSLPAKIALSCVGGFLFLVAWAMYSARYHKSLKKGKFGVMEILSETREEYGDASKIPSIARRFSRASITDIRRSFFRIGGDVFDPASRQGSIRVKGDVAFQYTDDDKMTMYGRQKPTNLSLRELVSEKNTMMEIEEDVFKRMNWSQKIKGCVPIKDQQSDKKNIHSIEGSFTFCHRDYVNHEELMGMMWKRYGIEGFLFKPSRADVLVVDKDSKCVMTAQSKLFRFIPISITWKGKLEDGSINWYTTSLTMGWESFGKFFDKPAAAEKLRKDPWHISIPQDDSSCDILCFNREGKGHLVYAKEECLSGGRSLKMKSQ